MFQFGNLSGKQCSGHATLDLNLMGVVPDIWTKSRSGNTLAPHHSRPTDSDSTGLDWGWI
jgi:hypothetical protein